MGGDERETTFDPLHLGYLHLHHRALRLYHKIAWDNVASCAWNCTGTVTKYLDPSALGSLHLGLEWEKRGRRSILVTLGKMEKK